MSLFPPGGNQALPGLGPKQQQTRRVFLTNNNHLVERGVKVSSTTVDAGSVPTTKLRPGLMLVRVEAGPNLGLYTNPANADAPAAADVLACVILMQELNMLDKNQVAEKKMASGVIHGFVKESLVLFDTVDPLLIDALEGALPLVQFEK